MPNCPGSCNARYRAAAARYQAEVAAHARLIAALAEGKEPPDAPRPPGIEPEPGEPVWCVRCAGRIRRQLAELDDLAALTAARPPAPRADKPDDGAGRVSGTREPPSPSPAGDTLEELAGWARDWEAVVRGIEPLARRGFLATQLTTSFAHLIALFDRAITAPDYAADLGAEIRRWHRDLSGLAGAGQAARHKPKPCPRCRRYTLWETTGKDHIWCSDTDCGRLLTREEYAALDGSLRVRARGHPVGGLYRLRSFQSLRPVAAILKPRPIIIIPPAPPIIASRRGDRANHCRAVPAVNAHTLSSTSAMRGNRVPRISI